MDKKTRPKPADLTIRLLEQIRDEVAGLRTEMRGEVGALRTELTGLRTELSERMDRLEQRQSTDSIRLATELAEVGGAVVEMRDMMRERRADRAVLGDHEARIRALERKTA